MTKQTDRILSALSSSGILMKQDKRFPNVITMLTGESLATSWWSHPKGRLIFQVLSELSDHPDVLFTKLLLRKVTLVSRSLWPAFLVVAQAGEKWQLQGLSQPARNLIARVNKSAVPILCSGKLVKEIEFRLLANATEVHTETGSHKTALESWSAWKRRVRVTPLRSAEAGRRELEDAAKALGIPLSAFPWSQCVY